MVVAQMRDSLYTSSTCFRPAYIGFTGTACIIKTLPAARAIIICCACVGARTPEVVNAVAVAVGLSEAETAKGRIADPCICAAVFRFTWAGLGFLELHTHRVRRRRFCGYLDAGRRQIIFLCVRVGPVVENRLVSCIPQVLR